LKAPPVGGLPQITNLATVAIVPVSHDVPLNQFTHELNVALNEIGKEAIKFPVFSFLNYQLFSLNYPHDYSTYVHCTWY
jgi:hypothetical protein